jgi:hypothetical protein
MTRRGKWVSQRAQDYLDSQFAVGFQLKQQMAAYGWPMLPVSAPLFAILVLAHEKGWHNKDPDNQLKAVLDACSGIVYKDDRWLDFVAAYRHPGKTEVARLTVGLMEEIQPDVPGAAASLLARMMHP